MGRDNRRLYSSMRFEGDGVTKVVALTFELREGDGLSVDFGYGLVDSGYIIDYDSQPVLIIFDEPLPKQTITIRRLTQISEVPHVFQKTGNAQGGSPFNAKNIDENFENITRASQDAMDSQVLASETLEEMSGIRDDSKKYRDEAEESAREARESEDSARISASASLTGATASAQSASKAEGHELKAKAWATNPENVEVEGGKYSAYHWANKAKEIIGFDPDEYRKLDDNIFNGYLQVRSGHEGQGTGVSLQDTDGTVRGQVVATDQGLQLTQYPEAGGVQTFTFPSEGGELALNRDIPYIEDFGGVADYDPITGNGTDNSGAFKRAFAKSPYVRLKSGLYKVSGGIDVPPYGALLGASNAYESAMSDKDYIVYPHGTYIVVRDAVKSWHTNAMITKCELSGGVLPNPNAGDEYTLTSEGRLDSYELVDLTNQDAVGTKPATPREMSYGVKLQRGSLLLNCHVVTTSDTGSLRLVKDINNWGNPVDIGVIAENGIYGKVINSTIEGSFREYGLLSIQHESGDGYFPQGDRFTTQNVIVEGHTSVGIRGADRCKVYSVDDSTISIKWFKSHMFPEIDSSVYINGKHYDYSKTSISEDLLVFHVMNTDGIRVGDTLIRGLDARDYGTGGTYFSNTFFKSITHPMLNISTSSEYSDPFPYSGKLMEISGNVVRGIHFDEGCYFHGREDIAVWVHSAGDVYLNGYHEAKFIREGSAASRFIALSLEKLHEMGFTEATRGASYVQFLNWSQTEANTCRSPMFSTNPNRGRFGKKEGLFFPAYGVANDYHLGYGKDNYGAVVHKLPSSENTEMLGYQIRRAGDRVVFGVDGLGRTYLGSRLNEVDLSKYRRGYLSVINDGGNIVDIVNTRSGTTTGIECINSNGSVGLRVDGSGGHISVNNIPTIRLGTGALFPSDQRDKYNIGMISSRFDDLYLKNQPNVQSDVKFKEDISEIDSKYMEVMSKIKFKQFKLKDGSSGRTHFGIIAQDWIKACEEVGVDPKESGVLIGDDKTGYSIRYTELMVLHNAYLEWRIEQLGG